MNKHNNEDSMTMDYVSAEEGQSSSSRVNLRLSMVSLGSSSNSRGSTKNATKISFKVENKKNWAPTEIASRSQVYALKPTNTYQTQLNKDIEQYYKMD